MTTKQRAYLKSLAMTMDAILQIGKSSLTPELTQAVDEALALMPYPFDTCLHDTFLFEAKTDDCVRFEDC